MPCNITVRLHSEHQLHCKSIVEPKKNEVVISSEIHDPYVGALGSGRLHARAVRERLKRSNFLSVTLTLGWPDIGKIDVKKSIDMMLFTESAAQ